MASKSRSLKKMKKASSKGRSPKKNPGRAGSIRIPKSMSQTPTPNIREVGSQGKVY